MIAYWLLYTSVAAAALLAPQTKARTSNILWLLAFCLLTTFVGLRDGVGADWIAYLAIFDYVNVAPLSRSLALTDPGYIVVNWISSKLGWGVYGVNVICAAILMAYLIQFCRDQSRPAFALALAIPVAVIMVSMGYTRQAVAIGFIMASLLVLRKRNVIYFLFYIMLATAFHRSAILFAPLAIVIDSRGRVWNIAAVILFLILIYFSWAHERFDLYAERYLEGPQSAAEGAVFRVMMNALPAAAFLVLRARVPIDSRITRLWTYLCLAAVGAAGILLIIPSSTIIDRFSLYLMPVQLFVLATAIPSLRGLRGWTVLYEAAILFVYAMVLWVWFHYGQEAKHWIPYKTIISL